MGRAPSPRSVLPASASRFLGRDEELSQLAQLLEATRLVTLTGAPGIGKTRLALELSGEHAGDYHGRARVVELAPIARPADVPRALASALSVEESASEGVIDTIVARVGKRRLLVVLDNCEHLIGPCAELARALLDGCPELRILATSREPLALAGERVWSVPPLAVPGPADNGSPETLGGYAAVGLFAERAGAAQPGFSLNAYLAPAVAEICRRLDGIPLAIELAAARVQSLTPEEITRRLDDRFGLLKDASGNGLPRHQTLQAALDWSHDLLPGPERTLLARLSVFVGGFELEAAQAVCAGGEVSSGQVRRLLGRLVSRSLVAADTDSSPTTRYRLLETIRAYAGERLEEAGEVPTARAAHASFHLALAERAEPELTGPAQGQWLERLETERANLRSALEWALGHGETEQALRLAGALVLFWRVRCHFSEGRELLDATLSAGDGAGSTRRAKALWGAGFMALMLGDRESAAPLLEQSLARYRELGDRQGCARALMVLGNCIQFSDPAEGLSLLEESAVRARAAGDPWCLDHALALAGFGYVSGNDLPTARPLFEECLLVAREAGDKQGLRFGLMGLGSIALHLGDLQLAQSLFEEALTVTSELGEDYGRARALHQLGQLAILRGEYGRAGQLLDEALALTREVAGDLALPAVLELRASASFAEGDYARARQLYEEALALVRSSGRKPIAVLCGMGRLAAAEGDASAARRLYEEALELADRGAHKAATAEALHGLGKLARREGDAKRAAVLLDEALVLWHEAGSPSGIVGSLEAIAGMAAQDGHYERAALLLGAARARREANGYLRPGGSQYEEDLALVRAGLSAEELDTALAQGAGLSIDEAVARASMGGGRPGRRASGWASLTEREQEVAELVAKGLTNPQIAECLFISRGTVKRHLSHIFEKLGLASRTELSREVRARRQQRLEPAGSN